MGRDVDVDVVVVGGGAGGLAAATSAAAAGARVLLAECEGDVGGSSALSDAFLMAAGTRHQAREGVVDTPEAMLAYYLALNRRQVEIGLARALCEDSASVVDWLEDLGCTYGPLERAGAEEPRRGHLVDGNGAALVRTLLRAARERGVDVALGQRVDDLVIDEGGAVCGVRAGDDEIRASAVVITSGGFTRNAALLREHYAGRMLTDDVPLTPSGLGSRGDAIEIGDRLGAAVVGQGRGHWVPFPLVSGQTVLVTRDGRRFVDESADHSVRTAAAAYHGHTYYAVLDEDVRRGRPLPPFAARTVPTFLYHDGPLDERDETIARWRREGRLCSGTTVHQAATAAGLDAAAVSGAVDAYNDACRDGVDRAFEKDPSMLVPLRTPPFHVVRVEPLMLVATFCGLRIDADARVISRVGTPIRGLFAAGECTGGVIGEVYAGHGNSLMNALVFGRRAGVGAAALT